MDHSATGEPLVTDGIFERSASPEMTLSLQSQCFRMFQYIFNIHFQIQKAQLCFENSAEKRK